MMSLLNLVMNALKIFYLNYKNFDEFGFLKFIIFTNLVCLVIYNFIQSFELRDTAFHKFIDSLINSLMYALVLLLNLVLIDSQTEIGDKDSNQLELSYMEEVKKFIKSKVAICSSIFIILFFFMYTPS